MPALTTEEFITWANRLANLPWPMTTEEFAKIAAGEFGWTIFDGKQVLAITLPNYSERVFVGKTSEGEVRKIHFPLARTKTEDRDAGIELNDLFASYATVGTENWGNPTKTEHGMESSNQLHPASCPHTILGTVHLLHSTRSPLLRVATNLEQHIPTREGANTITSILEDARIYDVDVIYTPER